MSALRGGRLVRRILIAVAVALCSVSSRNVLAGPGYVIITTTNIVAGSTQLTNFVAWKQSLGFDVQVVSNTAAGWGGGIGDTAANRIRDWLRANWTNQAGECVIDFVLLVGDPQPTNGAVPMKMCYPYQDCPTDYYYAELTCNWNTNGNAFYGEWNDFDGDPTLSDVFVGRIPYYGVMADLDGILAKTITYESQSRAASKWRNKALLAMDMDRLIIDTEILGEWVKDGVLIPSRWSSHRVYDNHIWSNPETTNCCSSNVVSVWTNSSFGAVFWFCHGSQTSTGNQVIELPDVPLLDNNHPVFTFQGSCLTAHPETTNNLAYVLLCNGAVCTVGATRDATFSDANPRNQAHLIPGFLYGYAKHLVRGSCPSAVALQMHKASAQADAPDTWRNWLDFNVYGDPSLGIHVVRFTGPVWAF